MKKWIPFLLLLLGTSSFAQDEIERIHAEVDYVSGNNENGRSTEVNFHLTEHLYPTRDSAAVRIRVFITYPDFAENDKLNFKAPFSDAYLSAAELDGMLQFTAGYVQSSGGELRSIYWKSVTEGFRVGVQIGPRPRDKQVIFELWGVRKPYDFERFIANRNNIAAMNRRAQELVTKHQLQQ